MRAIRHEAVVLASPEQVWKAWTTSEGAATFFGPKARIELKLGGPYEIYFDPRDERLSSKGMKVLSFAPTDMLSFEWNAPPQFPNVRKGGTWVVVQLRPEETGDRTRVTLQHLGFKSGDEWDKAYDFFTAAWSQVMQRLQRRFAEGPIDWSKEK